MFCPKCGSENIDDAKFCRSCGANISLVPQALTGELPKPGKRDLEKPASLSQGVSELFGGLAFLIIAILLSRSAMGTSWWFWLLIPALGMLGKGIGKISQAHSEQQKALSQSQTKQEQIRFQPTHQRVVSELHSRDTTEFITPPTSVTEHTTRHLGAEVPTKVFNDKS